MPPSMRQYLADEELGKKDDDHWSRPRGRVPSIMTSWKSPRPRRLILAVLAVYLLYLFFKNMPADIGPTSAQRYNVRARLQSDINMPLSPPQDQPLLPVSQQKPSRPPPPPPQNEPVDNYRTNGRDEEVTLLALGSSLRRVPRPKTDGPPVLPVVVFAGSELKSISDLVPLACQMARSRLNSVHFVLMGRGDVSLEGVQQVNGVDYNNCPMIWHGMLFQI